MAQFQLGSISTGTLRTEDLLPVFVDTLLGIDNSNRGQTHGYPFTYQNAWDSDYDADSYWNSAYPNEDLEIVSNLLNELCPPFVYFGTHPGDGADFGFWPDSNSLDEALYNQTGAPHLDNVPSYSLPMHQDYPYGEIALEDDNVIVQLSDHGNVTVMDMERNVIWSVV